MWRRKKGRKEENVVKEDSFFAHRITSDAHLLWAVKQGCAQAYLTVLSAWKPPHFYAGAMVLVKAWVKGGLKCRVCYPLCFFSVRVAASLALGPRQWFLLRKSELGLSAAGLVHSRPELPDQVGGKYCVSSSGEGLPFHCLLRGEEEETGLSTASDLGFTSKSETEFRTRDCSDPNGSIWFLMHTWAASNIKSRDKSHLHLSSQQYFLNMNCDFLGDLWGRNAITYSTVTWDNIYYQ